MKSVPMLGDEKKLDSGDMFHVFNVDELIPPNHLLRRLDAVLDTSWVRKEAGLVSGRHVSIEGTKIKANASWGSLEPIVPVVSLNEYLENRFRWDDRARESKDDDGEGACLAYIGNFCIDTKFRVVLGAEASPGRTNGEWTAGINMLDFVGDVLVVMPEIVTADKGYGVVLFYSEVEKRGIISHIPTRNRTSETHLPTSRLLGMKTVPFDRAKKMIAHRRGITARNRVQRIKNTRGYRVSRLLRLRVEHKIGEAKECHGPRRARHRGLDKIDHQVKITAAVMNLKQLAQLGFRPVGATARRIASTAGRLHRLPSLVRRMLDRVLHRIFNTSPRLAFATGHSSQGFQATQSCLASSPCSVE